MNPLLYLLVGFLEWYLALRRTLACVRQERITLAIIVFIENFLGLLVLQSFIATGSWPVAIAYSIGGSLGALYSINSTRGNQTNNTPHYPQNLLMD